MNTITRQLNLLLILAGMLLGTDRVGAERHRDDRR
jgi:hypothetical protein